MARNLIVGDCIDAVLQMRGRPPLPRIHWGGSGQAAPHVHGTVRGGAEETKTETSESEAEMERKKVNLWEMLDEGASTTNTDGGDWVFIEGAEGPSADLVNGYYDGVLSVRGNGAVSSF